MSKYTNVNACLFSIFKAQLRPKFFGLAGIVLGLGAQFNAPDAWSKQVIVKFRSPEAFTQVQSDLTEFQRVVQSRTHETSLWGFNAIDYAPRLIDKDFIVTDALDQLNMAVIDVPDEANLETLSTHNDVEYISEDFLYPLPMKPLEPIFRDFRKGKLKVNPNEITWGLKAVKALEAWKELGALRSTQPVVVTVLDTGIDKSHPDLKNQFGIGEDFVSRGLEEPQLAQIFSLKLKGLKNPLADYSYFDTNGHGTHVSGTIAAALDQVGVAGVAPNARINMGRVCGKFGCSDVAIVKAINWAVKNKTQVISMSLGGPMQSKSQKEALAAAEKAGVINVAASGNSGTPEISYPAGYPSVISVGAIDEGLNKASFSQWGPTLDVVAPGVDVNSSVPIGSGRESLVQIGTTEMKAVKSTSFVGAQESFDGITGEVVAAGLGRPEDFTANKVYENKIVLIKRGEIPFADKVKNAIKVKAKGVLIYNNTEGLMSGGLTQDGSVLPITAAMIEKNVGEKFSELLSLENKVMAAIKVLKTDYAAFQGTSMATPHVAGVVALMLTANPKLNTVEVRNILTSTAVKVEKCKNEENQCGAGLVDAFAAVKKARVKKISEDRFPFPGVL